MPLWFVPFALAQPPTAHDWHVGGGATVTGLHATARYSLSSGNHVEALLTFRLATVDGFAKPPTLWIRELDEGEMLVQALVGPTIRVDLGEHVFLGFGLDFDALAPIRSARDVANWNTIFGPVFEAIVLWPFGTVLNAIALSQGEVTVGGRLGQVATIEVGVWPSTVPPISPLLSQFSTDGGTGPLRSAAPIDLVRPGVLLAFRL